MKKIILQLMVLGGILGIFGCSSDPSRWSEAKLDQWFQKGEWLNGWTVKPDASVNKREFAVSYFKNKERWDKAFKFLSLHDLTKLEVKRIDIDGNNLYATVTEYLSKNEGEGKFEVHRKYADIQYVISGLEQIGIAPLSAKKETVTPYDETKDIEFMTVADSAYHKATPGNFFIFFPSEIHKPGMKADSIQTQVKKVVVKVKLD
ncbi:MAG TPA: YhcH/YjgK/YiaL family protein [Bacteroidales bacterium]|jgi:YhcH/YjgK/YiaL family protein|nr:YhcH/YjgK/YiaL family protein [Bacteroidales bacterium]